MRTSRYLTRLLAVLLLAIALPAGAGGAPALRVAYAGSMGVVMDLALGPAFAKAHDATWQGIGQGSYALARLLAAGQMRADVFVGITPGPLRVLAKAGLVTRAVPIASTRMVVIYSPKSRFAADFDAVAQGKRSWYDVLRQPGLRLGRTNPAIDPQGANALLALQLAARYYHQPGLLHEIAGPLLNGRQIFSEASLMSRLLAGQVDAAIGYRSSAVSHHLPTINLPPAVDLADPAFQATWYARARLTLADGKILTPQPLVFYAAVLDNARHPALARAFVRYLQSAQGQKQLRSHGYDAPHGAAL
ncbi:MAG: extracellular solute-binding protein [Rhodanobacteraceae bacterium]|nr:MAG: extracellular solute-binding protein [Rhodanobacteraceae bacterium]